MSNEVKAWWFGCWGGAGHFLHDQAGAHVGRSGLRPCPFVGASWLDGGLAPRRVHPHAELRIVPPPDGIVFTRMGRDSHALVDHLELLSSECAQGEALLHHTNGCTVAAWWDRTQGDTRPGSNSCLIVEGKHTAQAMLDLFPRLFPVQARRLSAAGVTVRFLRTQ